MTTSTVGRSLLYLIIFFLITSCGYINYSVNGTKRAAFFVVDRDNDRVLIWWSIPTVNQQPADIVLGQPNMTTNGSGTSAVSYTRPRSVFFDGRRFMITELNNNRAFIWNSIPTVNQQPPDIVLGQPDYNSSTANNTPGSAGTISAYGLQTPRGIFSTEEKLYVLDIQNNRILVWSSFPTTIQQPADIVIGQSDMGSSGASGTGFNLPSGISSDGQRLLIADTGGHRVLIWNSIPTTNSSADVVLGQPSLATVVANNTPGSPGTVSAYGLNQPNKAYSDGKRLFVCEQSNNRALIWNSIPTTHQQPADVVLGQPNMSSSANNNTPGAAGTTSAYSLSQPTGIYSDGVRVYVADRQNHRVLIWNSIPTTNQQPADIVLGQPNMNIGSINSGGSVTAQTMSAPVDIYSNAHYSGLIRSGGY